MSKVEVEVEVEGRDWWLLLFVVAYIFDDIVSTYTVLKGL